MKKEEMDKLWAIIQTHYERYLRDRGVELPGLYTRKGTYTKDALTLLYLAQGYPETHWITKSELTAFIRGYYPDTNDVQSARHLGMQKGFYIVSSRRGNFYPPQKPPPPESAYLLVSLEEPHPAFRPKRVALEGFESIKAAYDFRCATCGSKEGEENFRYKGQKTILQQGHKNPHLPLTPGNIIPQCQFCNRADRNQWVYDERERVIGVASSVSVIRSIEKGFLPEIEVRKLFDYLRKRYESAS